jgi:hypothetical protein
VRTTPALHEPECQERNSQDRNRCDNQHLSIHPVSSSG